MISKWWIQRGAAVASTQAARAFVFLVVPSSHIIHDGFLSNLSIKDREILTVATAKILQIDNESLWGVLLWLHQHDVNFLSAHPSNPLLQKLHAEYVCYVCFGLRNTSSLQTQRFYSWCGIPSQMGLPKGIETYEAKHLSPLVGWPYVSRFCFRVEVRVFHVCLRGSSLGCTKSSQQGRDMRHKAVWHVDFRELEMSPCQICLTKRWWGLDYTTKFQRSCAGGAQKLPVVSGFGFDVARWRWVLMSGFSSMISDGRTSEDEIAWRSSSMPKEKHPKSSL